MIALISVQTHLPYGLVFRFKKWFYFHKENKKSEFLIWKSAGWIYYHYIFWFRCCNCTINWSRSYLEENYFSWFLIISLTESRFLVKKSLFKLTGIGVFVEFMFFFSFILLICSLSSWISFSISLCPIASFRWSQK